MAFNHRLLASKRLYFEYIHHTCFARARTSTPVHCTLPTFQIRCYFYLTTLRSDTFFFFLVITWFPPWGRLVVLKDSEWGRKSRWIDWIGGEMIVVYILRRYIPWVANWEWKSWNILAVHLLCCCIAREASFCSCFRFVLTANHAKKKSLTANSISLSFQHSSQQPRSSWAPSLITASRSPTPWAAPHPSQGPRSRLSPSSQLPLPSSSNSMRVYAVQFHAFLKYAATLPQISFQKRSATKSRVSQLLDPAFHHCAWGLHFVVGANEKLKRFRALELRALFASCREYLVFLNTAKSQAFKVCVLDSAHQRFLDHGF